MSKTLTINYENIPCYNIEIRDSYDDLSSTISRSINKSYDNICIVTDSNVAKLYLDSVKNELTKLYPFIDTFIFEAGEQSKNLTTVNSLYEKLIVSKYTRNSLLIALGGGVVGDLTGFAASTFLRGIDFIQIPTTLLSQVDSSIGGKTGVDFNQYKNMVGAFYMPKLVYMNTNTLQTLDNDNFVCGMGEVVKSALIQDVNLYTWLKSNYKYVNSRTNDYLEYMIFECCKIKGNIVQIDPKEKGIRCYLNFGHTIGHAIEKLSNFTLGHGQCVSLGMISAIYLSKKLSYLSPSDVTDIIETLKLFNMPLKINNLDANQVLSATKSDKKMIGKKIKFVVLKSIGNAEAYNDFTDADLSEAINEVIE